MSHSSSILSTPSSEFVILCRSQVELLTERFKADWSAVYLTARWTKNSNTDLFPVVTYPEQFSWQGGIKTRWLECVDQEASIVPSLLETFSEINDSQTEIESFKSIPQHRGNDQKNQIILPLVYEELVMGLLVTGRKELPWHEAEFAQIEKIAKTLAIACFLDQRQDWYKQQLQQQYAQNAHQRDLFENLLHQLRNPLTALRTFGKLLLKRLLPDERDQNVVKGIIRESDRIQDLLQQFEEESNLLTEEEDFASTLMTLPQTQLSSPLLLPSVSLVLEPISVEEVLTPLLVSAQAIAQEKKLYLSSTIVSNLPFIQANYQALREVLSNLIDNAIKYTPAGGKVEINIQFKDKNKWQGIEISDTGYGIPLKDQDHIFERRYRGIQAEGNIPGTGLGLAIVKDLVEQMQGKIEFISPNGKSKQISLPGTTFIVWFAVIDD